MLRYIIWAFIFYWLFRFVFNFLVPIFRATRQMKGQMHDFQSKMGRQGNFQSAGSQQAATPGPQAPQQKPRKGDYIDFEEVR